MATRTKRLWVVGAVAVKVAAGWAMIGTGCSTGSTAAPSIADGGGGGAAATYYADVKPIVDAKCIGCHVAGGIAPFPLTTFEEVHEHKAQIAPAVESRTMPPWPPGQGCTEYEEDRSLPQAMIDTLSAWARGAGAEGDPATYRPITQPVAGLSRVDRRLAMPAAFTPTLRPDHYRCFVLDWPDATTTYITGLNAIPGQPSIVHHMLVFKAAAAEAATYQGYDDADPGPGYDCFGGPYPNAAGDAGAPALELPHMLGGWAPGSLGDDFPSGTGLAIEPGAKIILQVHYNTLTAPPVADRSELDVKLDSSVTKEAAVMPWTNPQWPRAHTMSIPAGDPDAGYSFAFDGVTGASQVAGFAPSTPFTVYSAALHMHLHGTHATFSLERADGGSECMLEIPHWNFHWQGSYGLAAPKVVAPGDQLKIECHWDNSAANQPIVDNAPTPVGDLNWGEGTTQEMCIGFLYVTR